MRYENSDIKTSVIVCLHDEGHQWTYRLSAESTQYNDFAWALWSYIAPVTQLFVQQPIQVNTEAMHYWLTNDK